MVQACRSLGAAIELFPDHILVQGVDGIISGSEDVIHAGNSGIILRFLSAVAALGNQPIAITGDQSIRTQRPMQDLLNGLSQMGAKAISTRNNGYAPLIIQGPLKGGRVEIQGRDSQPVSALLIAASFCSRPTEILVTHPGERPWIDLTLHWLKQHNLAYVREGYERYLIPGNGSVAGFSYVVPGDFSSAAYPLVAALITNSEVVLENVCMADPQGDKKLIQVLQQMGARIDVGPSRIVVRTGSVLKGLEIDINDFIDAITILSVAGCFAEGETRIRNASIAKQKECNRIQCIVSELKKMGADITAEDDGITVRRSELKGAQVLTHQDQRMVMSLAVAGLAAEGTTQVCDAGWAAKTFPTFKDDFKALGASIE